MSLNDLKSKYQKTNILSEFKAAYAEYYKLLGYLKYTPLEASNPSKFFPKNLSDVYGDMVTLEKILKEEPNNLNYRILFGEYNLLVGNLPKAIKHYEMALSNPEMKNSTQKAQIFAWLTFIHFNEDEKKALEYIREAYKLKPDLIVHLASLEFKITDWYFWAIKINTNKKNPVIPDDLSFLSEIFAPNVTSPADIMSLGNIYAFNKQYAIALDYYLKYISIKSGKPALYLKIGDLCREMENYKMAIDYYEKNVDYMIKHHDEKFLIECYKKEGFDLPYTLPTKELYLKRKELMNEIKKIRIDGLSLLKSGGIEKGFELLNEALKKYPNDPITKFSLGHAMVLIGEKSEGLRRINEQMEQNKNNTSFLEEIIDVYVVLGMFEEAKASYEEFLKSERRNHIMIKKYARMLSTHMKEYSKAIQLIENLQKVSYSPYHFVELGNIYMQKGDLKKAMELFISALLQKKNNLDFILRLVEVHTKMKNYNMAIAYSEEAVNRHPESNLAKEKLNMLYSLKKTK